MHWGDIMKVQLTGLSDALNGLCQERMIKDDSNCDLLAFWLL